MSKKLKLSAGSIKSVKGANPSVEGSIPRVRSAYFNGEANPFMVGFRPQLREHYQDVQAAWHSSASRAAHFIQNSGFIRGIVDTAESITIGSDYRLSARPRARLLGWDQKHASEWGDLAETLFEDWASNKVNCDAAARFTFNQQLHAAHRGWFAFGEILSLFPAVEDAGMWKTKLKLLPPTRLKSDSDSIARVVQGIRLNELGRPIGYLFRSPKQIAGADIEEIEIAANDSLGRPNVLHVMDPEISAVRGISILAPIIKVTRQIDQFADAALTKALISTVFAASLRTASVGETAFDGLFSKKDLDESIETLSASRGGWYDGANIDFTQHGRIAHLYPGDVLDFHQGNDPAPQFDIFMQWMFREIAKCVGLSYESSTADYRGATYSSIRMAGASEWLTVMKRRSNIVSPLAQAAYEMVLDEAVFTGRLPFPGGYQAFLYYKDAACAAAWLGPPRPQADDLKTAKAMETRMNIGLLTLEEGAAEYGGDWDTRLRQQARENELARELGLPEPHTTAARGYKSAGEAAAEADAAAEAAAEAGGGSGDNAGDGADPKTGSEV